MDDLPKGHPGCLVASVVYQERLFDSKVHELNKESLLIWRRRFRDALNEIAAIYPPKDDVNLDDVADMVTSTVEGGIVLSKALQDPKQLGNQLMLFRSYIKLLFTPTVT